MTKIVKMLEQQNQELMATLRLVNTKIESLRQRINMLEQEIEEVRNQASR